MAITVFLPLMLCFWGSLGWKNEREVVTTESRTCTTYNGVKCWGWGGYGGLGTGSSSNQKSPPTDPIDMGSDFAAFKTSCANTHCCSLSTGHSVKCWGKSFGNDIPEYWSGGGIHDIMVLEELSCVLKWPGDVYCFGYNHYDLFTTWSGNKEQSQAVKMRVGFEVDKLGGGHSTLCVVKANGRVTCEGGQSSLAVSNRDVGGAVVESVACGMNHCCAHTSNPRTLDCWGSGPGLPPTDHGLYVRDVGVGMYSTCILSSGRRVNCYGWNNYHQLGSESSSSTTSNDFRLSSDFSSSGSRLRISSGGYAQHFCVHDKELPLMQCWGYNNIGQLGYGDDTARSYSKRMPMVAVGALCAPYLTGFHYTGFDGEWTEVEGVTKNNAPVYERQTSYGKRYLWRYLWMNYYEHWVIGADYNRDWFYMIREGHNLFDPCQGSQELNAHYHCHNWKYYKNRKWRTTPGRSEHVSCFNVDASASIASSAFTEEGELGPGFDESGSGDFVAMMAGAAVGALLVAVIVAVVVAMRKKKATKSTELEMTDAVHVPVDAVTVHSSHVASVTESVSMDAVETTMSAEMEKETEAEVEVVTAMETDAGC